MHTLTKWAIYIFSRYKISLFCFLLWYKGWSPPWMSCMGLLQPVKKQDLRLQGHIFQDLGRLGNISNNGIYILGERLRDPPGREAYCLNDTKSSAAGPIEPLSASLHSLPCLMKNQKHRRHQRRHLEIHGFTLGQTRRLLRIAPQGRLKGLWRWFLFMNATAEQDRG